MKRVLSILLAVLMVVSIVPLVAMAAGGKGAAMIDDTVYETLQAAVDAVQDGQTIILTKGSMDTIKAPARNITFKIISPWEKMFTVNDNGSYKVTEQITSTNEWTYTVGNGGGDTPNPPDPPTPPAPSTGFSDVKPSDYFAAPVKWVVDNNITAGTGGNKFSPGKTCTRDQIVTFLYRSKNSPEVTITDQFTDMPKLEEFQRAISWAVEQDITVGDGKGHFLPAKGCTRAQAVTFIWRAAGEPEPKSMATFSDMPYSSDFQKAISWASENGITSGVGGNKFGPDKTCTRGQIVTFLYNAKDL